MGGAAWLVAAFVAVAAGWDLACRRIPNAWTATAAAIAGVWLAATGHGPLGAGAGETLLVTAALLPFGLLALHLRVLGAGDVKLFLALSLLAGPAVFAQGMLLGSLACGLCALAFRLVPTLEGSLAGVPWLHAIASGRGGAVPLAVPYALGVLTALAAWAPR